MDNKIIGIEHLLNKQSGLSVVEGAGQYSIINNTTNKVIKTGELTASAFWEVIHNLSNLLDQEFPDMTTHAHAFTHCPFESRYLNYICEYEVPKDMVVGDFDTIIRDIKDYIDGEKGLILKEIAAARLVMKKPMDQLTEEDFNTIERPYFTSVLNYINGAFGLDYLDMFNMLTDTVARETGIKLIEGGEVEFINTLRNYQGAITPFKPNSYYGIDGFDKEVTAYKITGPAIARYATYLDHLRMRVVEENARYVEMCNR